MECLHKYNMYKNKSTINKRECKVLHQNNVLWSVKWYTIWHIKKSQYHMNGFSQNIYFDSFTFETITYFFSCYKGLLLVKLLIKLGNKI